MRMRIGISMRMRIANEHAKFISYGKGLFARFVFLTRFIFLPEADAV